MAYIIADNVISPLGDTSWKNYQAVKEGLTSLVLYTAESKGVGEDYTASVIEPRVLEGLETEESGLPWFEKKILASVRKTVSAVKVDFRADRTIFILSSTKGEVNSSCETGGLSLADCAYRLSSSLGISSKPITVSNACISGLTAVILANRLLEQGAYETAIVCGTDNISKFVISGFQSLKAMSSDVCRPFDADRTGLNLGEAVATIVMSRKPISEYDWYVRDGYMSNDAYNLTSPSKTAEGLFRILSKLLYCGQPDFINLHGTATFFNDQMESVAIRRAGLSNVPANALKGYFGHTLGAAGLLETIISMKAADDETILATKGFNEPGVSGRMNLSTFNRKVHSQSFVKMLSGFGGCNAAALFQKGGCCHCAESVNLHLIHRVRIQNGEVTANGKHLSYEGDVKQMLTWLYKTYVKDYPRYYKMDMLCRLGFIASEILIKEEDCERFVERDDRAIVLFNKTSSIDSDLKYMESIRDINNYYPSPSLFIYTLPNIVTGEIAIRNKWHGETSLYILSERNESLQLEILKSTCRDHSIKSILTGWLDYANCDCYEADMVIYEVKREKP